MARPVSVDPALVETPCFVVDTGALADNLAILRRVQDEAGCKILLALKGFAMWATFPQIRTALPGVTSSSTHEARLGREQFGGEVHCCAAAYSDADFAELLELCDVVVFMKVYKVMARLVGLLDELGLVDRAVLVERCSLDDQSRVYTLTPLTYGVRVYT